MDKSALHLENIARCMPASARAELGVQTASEAQQRWQRGEERKIHEEVVNWLKVKGIPHVHARMDKPATIRKGWPDLTVLWGRGHGRSCCVELKAPGGVTSTEQRECLAELTAAGVPCCVAYSAKDAIDFIMRELIAP